MNLKKKYTNNITLFVVSSLLVLSVFAVVSFGALVNSRSVVSHNQYATDIVGDSQPIFPNEINGRYRFGTVGTLSDGQLGGNTIELSPTSMTGYDEAVLIDISGTVYTNGSLGLGWIKFDDLAEPVDVSTLGSNPPAVFYKTPKNGDCVWYQTNLNLSSQVLPAEVAQDGSSVKFYFMNGSVFMDPPVNCGVANQFIVAWNSMTNP